MVQQTLQPMLMCLLLLCPWLTVPLYSCSFEVNLSNVFAYLFAVWWHFSALLPCGLLGSVWSQDADASFA